MQQLEMKSGSRPPKSWSQTGDTPRKASPSAKGHQRASFGSTCGGLGAGGCVLFWVLNPLRLQKLEGRTGPKRDANRSPPQLLFKETHIRGKRAAPPCFPNIWCLHSMRWGGGDRGEDSSQHWPSNHLPMWWQAHFRPRLTLRAPV